MPPKSKNIGMQIVAGVAVGLLAYILAKKKEEARKKEEAEFIDIDYVEVKDEQKMLGSAK